MATGMELIFSTVCNTSFCEIVYENPVIDTERTNKQMQMLSMASSLNGKHLKIGTYNNYPLSWVENETNGTITGRGVAFMIVEILRRKFNFTFEVIVPENNFEIGFGKPESSLMSLVNNSVSVKV